MRIFTFHKKQQYFRVSTQLVILQAQLCRGMLPRYCHLQGHKGSIVSVHYIDSVLATIFSLFWLDYDFLSFGSAKSLVLPI